MERTRVVLSFPIPTVFDVIIDGLLAWTLARLQQISQLFVFRISAPLTLPPAQTAALMH